MEQFQTCNSFTNLWLNRSRTAQQLLPYDPKLVPRYPQDGPNMAPKRRKRVPRGPPIAPQRDQDAPKIALNGPKVLQDDSRMSQVGLMVALKRP